MKQALCVGINDYPGTYNDLMGCVNDCEDWAKLLSNLGFAVFNLRNSAADKATILGQLEELIVNAVAGDVIVFTYSGHGTYVPDTDNPDEADGYDEALYVYDGELLDDELRVLLNKLANGVVCVCIIDSCFSGTITRGDLVVRRKGVPRDKKTRKKFMPHSNDNFVKKFPHLYRSKKFLSKDIMKEIVLTGCTDEEYSYDAFVDGRWNGAMTSSALRVFTYGMTYETWYLKLRGLLPSEEYPQTPQLEGSGENIIKVAFKEDAAPVPQPTPEPEPIPEPEPQLNWWQRFIQWILSWF